MNLIVFLTTSLQGSLLYAGLVTSVPTDSEFDDLDSPAYRRPKSLDHLVSVTHFSRLELKRLYRAFKAECPTGLIREETFRAMYSQFFPKGGIYIFTYLHDSPILPHPIFELGFLLANGSQYPHYVFNSLSHDQSGVLGFEVRFLCVRERMHVHSVIKMVKVKRMFCFSTLLFIFLWPPIVSARMFYLFQMFIVVS